MVEHTTTQKTAQGAPHPRSGAPGRSSGPGGASRGRRGPGGRGDAPNRGRGGDRQRGGRRERPRSEFEQKILNIRRVTRVVSGGRRFSFSVAVCIGNRAGKVGVGMGKAGDTAQAIEKAVRTAKKRLVTIPRTKTNSIAYEVEAGYKASHIVLRPAPGRGLVAGSAVRAVLELGGISDISAKVLSRSKNQINNARATLSALADLPVMETVVVEKVEKTEQEPLKKEAAKKMTPKKTKKVDSKEKETKEVKEAAEAAA